MAPHSEPPQHANASGSMSPKAALGVCKSPSAANAGKASGSTAPFLPRGRDLQSAMQHAPTIRVIHIFAPKVIKTDVANFRSTVQKLTGLGKTKAQRRAARASAAASATAATESCPTSTGVVDERAQYMPEVGLPPGCPASAGSSSLYWNEEVLELQRMVGDACGVTDQLVRGDSVDSATYSLDSGHTFSGDSNSGACGASTCSPGVGGVGCMDPSGGFSFYPQREMAYSLSEIPAPFFTGAHGADSHYMHPAGSAGLPLPAFATPPHNNMLAGLPTSHLMDSNSLSSLGFDVDVGLPLPTLSEGVSNSTSGSLFDVMPRQHCRLSVQSPYPGANFFENIN